METEIKNNQNVYYKIVTTWCKWPFNDEIDEKYVEFYLKTKSKGSKRYAKIEGLKMDSATSIKDKEDYLKEKFGVKKIIVTKLHF